MSYEAIVGIIATFSTIMIGIISFGPIGRGIGDRLRGRSAGVPSAVQDQLDEVITRLEDVQRQLGEVAERQEFTERLLAQARERSQIGAGNDR